MDYGCPSLYDYGCNQVGMTSVNVDRTQLSRYFARALMQRAMSVFKWTVPETWDKWYFLYCLYEQGRVAVIDTATYGIIPQGCGLSGYNVFYRPNLAIIANPCLPGRNEYHIHSAGNVQEGDCALIHLQPDYGGLMDTVMYHADLLALATQDIAVNLVNCKLSYIFIAKNKAVAETLKTLFNDIAMGKPASVIDKQMVSEDGTPLYELLTQNVGQNYIVDKLVDAVNNILNQYDTEIGIANANTEKKERLLVDEINSNNQETRSRPELWLECLQDCIKKVKQVFPDLDLSVEWRNVPRETPREEVDGDDPDQ